MTGLNTGVAASVTKTAIDKVVFEGIADYNNSKGRCYATHPIAFMQGDTDRSAVITEQFQGGGYFATKAEQQDVTTSGLRVGNQKTSVVIEYSNGFDVPRTFANDDQHAVVAEASRDLGRKAMVTRDKNAFSVIYSGFTTSLTNDGVALYSNSHVALGGATVDNLETAVATDGAIETLINSLRTQKGQDGVILGYEPALLLCGTQLHKELMIITQSRLRSGTANNDLNYYSDLYPELQVMYSPFLDAAAGGSDSAHYLFAKQHGVKRWVREAMWTALVDWQYQDNNNYRYKAGYREVVDTISYMGTVASNGTV
jgi:hypothetical protein